MGEHGYDWHYNIENKKAHYYLLQNSDQIDLL